MKIRKTRQDKRSTYRYPVQVSDGKGGYRTENRTVRAGEDGVTEVDIRIIHSLDDSAVYYNNKNLRPERNEREKELIENWKKKFIADFKQEFGYDPNKYELKDAVTEAFPKNWNLSLDWEMDDDNGSDKSYIEKAASVELEHSNSKKDRLYEVMETMTDKQRVVLRMVKLEDRTLTEVAKILETSVANVKKHLDKAIKHIKNNY